MAVDPRLKALRAAIEAFKNQSKKSKKRTYDPAKQAEGYEKRLEGAGIDVEEATDNRNIIEKALNLKKDQNILFDIFEIINRPQQAIFGAIDEVQKGGNFFEGLGKGISGNKETPFGQILRNAGMSDKPIFGEVGMDDILGFVGDIFLDPMDIPFFGAPKMVKFGGKMVDYADRLADVSKAADIANEMSKSAAAAVDVATAAGKLEQLTDLNKKLAEATKFAAGVNQDLAALKKMRRGRRTLLQVALSGTGTGFNKMFRFADNKFEKFLEHLDAGYEKLAKSSPEAIAIAKTRKHIGALREYRSLKQGIRRIFDWAGDLKSRGLDILGSSKLVRGKQQAAVRKLQVLTEKLNADLDFATELIIESAREQGLYSSLLESAMKGRTIEDIQAIYPYMKDDIPALTKKVIYDYIDEITTEIMENGASMFGIKDGQIVATIKGLSQQTTIASMLDDNGFIYNMGLTEETKNMIEDYVKTHHKKWYDEHASNFKDGSMFTVSKAKDGSSIVDTWRFYEPLQGKDEAGPVLKSLRSELKKVKEIAETKADDLPVWLDNYDKISIQIEELNREIEAVDAISKSIRNGNLPKEAVDKEIADVRKVIPYDHPSRPAYVKSMNKLAENRAKLRDLQEQMAAVTGKGKKAKAKIDEILAESEKINNANKVLQSQMDRLRLKDGIDIGDYKAKLVAERAAYASNVTSKFSGVGRVSSVENYRGVLEAYAALSAKHEIPKYLNQHTIDHIAQYANLNGMSNYLTSIHIFMNESVNLVNEALDAQYAFQEGFMAHVMTEDWKALEIPKYVNRTDPNKFSGANFIGNSKVFFSRKYKASTAAANDMAKAYLDWLITSGSVTDETTIAVLKSAQAQDMFARSSRQSIEEFIRKMPKSAGDARMLNTVLNSVIRGQIEGSNVIIPKARDITASQVQNIPRGYVEVSRAALEAKIDQMQHFLKEDEEFGKILRDWLKKNVESEIFYIDKNVERLIGRIADREETSVFLRALEFINNVFKQNKLLSIGFPLRNAGGNLTNMYLAGIPMKDVFKYVRDADIALKKGGKWFVNDTLGVLDNLTPKEMEIFETYIEFTNHGFHDMGNKILEFPEHIRNASKKLRHKANPMRIYDKVTEFTFNLNEKQDTLYRFATYMWAKDNMDKVLEMGLDTPESFVRFALFDFQDLSVVEQDIYKKLIPFYTFTKKNLGFQMRNMMKNPNRYNRLMKGFDSMWDMLDLEPEELDRYTIENFWIPIPFLGEDGKFYAIKSSLPLGDLGEWASDPVRRLMASTSPVIRAPFEIATNTQTFSNMPIENFKGQKGFQIPELPRGAEYALGQFGLDVPVSQVFDLGRTAVQGFKGEISNPIDAISQGLLGTAVSKRDPAATKTRKAYEYLDELENLMRYYKQENIEIPTLAEINNRDKSGRIQAILNNLKSIIKRG